MQSAVAMIIRLVVRAPFIAVCSVVICLVLDPPIGGIVAACAVFVGVILWLIMHKTVPYYTRNQRSLDRLTQIAGENLEGARVVRAFQSRDKERARFDEAARDMLGNSLRVGRISAWINPLTFAVVNFGIAVILYISGFKVNAGTLTDGDIIAIINYMAQILNAMVVISNLVSLFTKAHAAMNRVSEVFDLHSSLEDEGTAVPDFSAPALAFEDVSFSYAGTDRYSLRGIRLCVPAGATVGIIGGTGSGKSTLISLLPRLYDAGEGCVRVFGQDVRDYKLEELRGLFGVVPQNAALFSGTVRSNLQWGGKDASDEELREALRVAAADFALGEGGLDRAVSEGGRNFSGGQRQRLTIARAVAAKPRILVLDDSCSALDFATDAKVRANIAALEDVTTVIVSQRASSLRGADVIFVLEDGKLVGQGKHEQLYENCPLYREICDSQARAQA